MSLLSDYVSNGAWGASYHTKFHKLSLNVAPIDDAIDILAKTFSSGIPRYQNEKGDFEDDGALIDFIRKPNKDQSFEEFSKDFVRNLYASGFSYLLPTSDSDANIRRADKIEGDLRAELKVLNTDFISYQEKSLLKRDQGGDLFYYTEKGIQIPYSYRDILPFWDKSQDPDNYRLGVSRLVALKDEITNVIISSKAKTNKIRQSGKFVLTPGSKAPNSDMVNLLDAPVDVSKPNYKHRNLIEDRISATGLSQDKAVLVTNTEMDVLNVMQSIQNYSYDDEVKEDKRMIKNALGIPTELQNIGDNKAKYENRKEARLELLTLSVMPLANNLCKTIQDFYEPNEKRKFVLDYSKNPAFDIVLEKQKKSLKEEIETLTVLYEKDLLTKDELRKKLKNEGII